MELHAKEKVSPLSGCLPSLFQLPAFFLLYHLFSNSQIGGDANSLLAHKLFAAPLGERWADALGDGGVVRGARAGVPGTVRDRRGRRHLQLPAYEADDGGQFRRGAAATVRQQVPGLGAITKVMPLMSFLTLFTVAVVPLAAALYVVTSTTWSAVERAVLYRDMPGAAPAAAVLG